MTGSINNPHSDLNRAMKEEARQEAEAEARATRLQALVEAAERADDGMLRAQIRQKRRDIEELESKIGELRTEQRIFNDKLDEPGGFCLECGKDQSLPIHRDDEECMYCGSSELRSKEWLE